LLSLLIIKDFLAKSHMDDIHSSYQLWLSWFLCVGEEGKQKLPKISVGNSPSGEWLLLKWGEDYVAVFLYECKETGNV